MNRRTVVLLAALVGGLAWIARWAIDPFDGSGTLLAALGWVGTVFLAIAVGGLGVGLVSRSAPWLQAIVAVALPLLVGSVLDLVSGERHGLLVDAIAGAVVIVVAGLSVRRHRPTEPEPPAPGKRAGAHAR